MNCPNCASNEFSPVRYGSVPGGRRLYGVAQCLVCRQTVRYTGGR